MKRRIGKVLITNAASLNGGDAAILQATIDIVRRRFGDDVDFTVYDMTASVSPRYYPSLRIKAAAYGHIENWAAPRFRPAVAAALVLAAARLRRVPIVGARIAGLLPANLRRVLADYADADLVISSGGTYLVPHYGLTAKLFDFLMTKALDRPLILFTQSLGPFPPNRRRPFLRYALRRADLILVRDDRSLRHLDELGIPQDRALRCADAAFALAPADLEGRIFPPSRASWNIAISVRDWPHFRTQGADVGMERYLSSVALLTSHLVERRNANVTFVSTCQGTPEYWTDDARVADEVVARLAPEIRKNVLVDRNFRKPAELIAKLKEFDLTVATRLHAAILSLCAGTPVLPISYEFKTTELFRQFGLGEAVVDVERIEPEAMLDAFEAACVFWTERAEEAWRTVRDLRISAFEAGAMVAERLAEGGLIDYRH